MNNVAYINGIEVSLEFAGIYHDVRAKINMGAELTSKEKEFCILINRIVGEHLKDEKERKKD